MSATESLVIACPACATLNRIARSRLGEGGTCGRCKSALFTGKPVTVTSASFANHAVRSDLPLLVDFWAAWCGPCQQMAPAFAAAAGTLEPAVRLGKVDTEAEQPLAAQYAVRSIPTLVLICKGKEIARTAGAMPAQAIVEWTRRALA